eukprot:5376186-Pyramimonas_sp.AAC.1
MLLDSVGEFRSCPRWEALFLQVAQPAAVAVPPHVGAVDVGLKPALSDHLARDVGDPGALSGTQMVLFRTCRT